MIKNPEDLRKRRPGCLVSPRKHWGLPGRGFRAGGALGPSRPAGRPGALGARGSPDPSPSSHSPGGALWIPGPGFGHQGPEGLWGRRAPGGPGGPEGPQGPEGPWGPPGPPGSWAPLGARTSIGPRRISRASGGPRGTGDPQRPRGGGTRKRTRGPLRAPRRPPGAWGLGAFSFQPPGGPKGSQVPIQQDPGPLGTPTLRAGLGCRGGRGLFHNAPEGPPGLLGPSGDVWGDAG